MTEDRKPAVYARVSTGRQTESLETQLERLRAGAPGATEFVDAGISGRGAERPAFDRLIAGIRAGQVSSLTSTKLDRLGRSAKTILEFFELAEDNDVRVVLLDLGIDTSTPMGRFGRTIAAAFAELEGDMIADRTREAMSAIKSGARATRVAGQSEGPRCTTRRSRGESWRSATPLGRTASASGGRRSR